MVEKWEEFVVEKAEELVFMQRIFSIFPPFLLWICDGEMGEIRVCVCVCVCVFVVEKLAFMERIFLFSPVLRDE